MNIIKEDMNIIKEDIKYNIKYKILSKEEIDICSKRSKINIYN